MPFNPPRARPPLARRRALTVAAVLAAALTACSSSSGKGGVTASAPATTGGGPTTTAPASDTAGATTGSTGTGPATGAATGAAPAAGDPALAALYAGILKSPDTTPRPGVKGKKVVVISNGQASISSSIPSNAAVEAGQALGWNTSLYDAQLQPAKAQDLVRQAIAAGADGIVVDANDCPTEKAALQEAKAKGVKVVGIFSFDCDDPIFNGAGGGQPLFSGTINYQGKTSGQAIDDFTKAYGAAQAKAIIAATGGKAKVIFFNDLEVTVLKYTGQGFLDEMKTCSGCSVVANVTFTGAELGPVLQQKVASALLQHPEANAIKSPFTAAALLGIAPALVQSGRQAKVFSMGGEGFEPELSLIRNRQGVDAVEITPSDWTGYAAIDTLNSLFSGKPAVDSGLGYQLVDRTHGLPASGPFIPAVDFKAVYKKAWGVG